MVEDGPASVRPKDILPRGLPATSPECTEIRFFASAGRAENDGREEEEDGPCVRGTGGAGVLKWRSPTVAERCIGAAATDAGRGWDDGGRDDGGAGVLVLVLASAEDEGLMLFDEEEWKPVLVLGREGTGMLSFCSASESEESEELREVGVDVDAGFALVLAFELGPGTERRLSFSGEPGATFATELAVG